VNYDVQPISRNADVLKRFRDTFDQLCFLSLGSSLPHLNNYYWHEITSGSLLSIQRLIIFHKSESQRLGCALVLKRTAVPEGCGQVLVGSLANT
jgi:hypothetical protein